MYLILALAVLHQAHALTTPKWALQTPSAAELVTLRQTNRLTSVARGFSPAGPIALKQGYEKYGLVPPADVMLAAKAVAGKSVHGTPGPADNAWFWPTTMGNSKLLMLFDTGSSDLWSASTLTPTSQRGNHSLYNPSFSGKRVAGETFNIQYGSGSAAGVIYADKVIVGQVTATSVAVGAATTVAQVLVHSEEDGIMGYAFPQQSTCSPTQCVNFFDVAYAQKQFPSPFFAVAMPHAKPGTWDFGFTDPTLYTGNFTFTEAINYPNFGSWGALIQGYSIGTGPIIKSGFDALIDTGTSLLFVPDVILNAYYAGVPGAVYDSTQGGVVFPCTSTSKLPRLNFRIDGQTRFMPGSYGLFTNVNSTYCYGGVQSDDGIGFAIFGNMFLRSQYLVFNPSTNVIGFAQQAGLPAH